MKRKFCQTCSRAKPKIIGWACRSCGAACCEHRCGNKVAAVATCGSCKLKAPFPNRWFHLEAHLRGQPETMTHVPAITRGASKTSDKDVATNIGQALGPEWDVVWVVGTDARGDFITREKLR